MESKKSSRSKWSKLRSELEAQPVRSAARIPRGAMPHPRDAGARATATFPVGQIADYGIEASGGPPLVVREFSETFEAAIDGIRMTSRLLESIGQQPTTAAYLGAALLGGAVGSSLSQKKEGTLVGVGLGLLVAAMLDKDLEGARRRK